MCPKKGRCQYHGINFGETHNILLVWYVPAKYFGKTHIKLWPLDKLKNGRDKPPSKYFGEPTSKCKDKKLLPYLPVLLSKLYFYVSYPCKKN